MVRRAGLVLAVVTLGVGMSWAQAPVQVMFDRSHEANGAYDLLCVLLNRGGVGVVDSNASLSGAAGKLGKVQALIIWQEVTSVPFTAEEVKLVKQYVGDGGTLILVGNVSNWVKVAGAGSRASDYPLVRLAAGMGVMLGDGDQEQKAGKGKVVYFHNRGALSYGNLEAEVRAGPGPAAKLFTTALGVGVTPAVTVHEVIPPEGSFKVGRVEVTYPSNLAERAALVKTWLGPTQAALEKVFECPLETSVHVSAIAFTGSCWSPYSRFSLNLWADPHVVQMDLARELACVWYCPGGRAVNMPPWVTVAWSNAAVRALKISGLDPNAGGLLKILNNEYRPADPKGNQIDLAVCPNPWAGPYQGKAIDVLEQLEKKSGMNVMARLRKAVRVCHATGDIAGSVDTNEGIRLLSLALGRDLREYLKSIGTTGEPKAPDFARFASWQKEIDELLPPR